MSNNILYLNEDDFRNEVLDSSQLVLVDFYADWCMPCKMLSPILEELATTNSDSLKVAKLNVDNARNLAEQYHVTGIPSMIFFKNGLPVANIAGLHSLQELQDEVEKFIKIEILS